MGSSRCIQWVTSGSNRWLIHKQTFPDLCSTAFILGCTRGKGKVSGAFSKASKVTNAYRGKLLGLMVVHLILLAISMISPKLRGHVQIYSDSLGTLGRVRDLPPNRISKRCRHLNILKNILVNCGRLSFCRVYLHVKAHQDDYMKWEDMTKEVQLSTACNAGAKMCLQMQDITNPAWQEPFWLEPICMFIDGKNMTLDIGSHIWYTARKQEACSFFHNTSRMFLDAFNEVDWANIPIT